MASLKVGKAFGYQAAVLGLSCRDLERSWAQRVTMENLARYQLAELFLETFPFNAGATASDALSVGLPLVTVNGEAFAARMAGSLLRSMGLSELVTNSLEDCEALATAIGAPP